MKTMTDFEQELEQVRKKLEESGRGVLAERERKKQGIKCDFDLPYSSLPPLYGQGKMNQFFPRRKLDDGTKN